MKIGGSSPGNGVPDRKGFRVSRVSLAYEQLVYTHCGREDTLRKRLELSHVRDQLRQVIVYDFKMSISELFCAKD